MHTAKTDCTPETDATRWYHRSYSPTALTAACDSPSTMFSITRTYRRSPLSSLKVRRNFLNWRLISPCTGSFCSHSVTLPRWFSRSSWTWGAPPCNMQQQQRQQPQQLNMGTYGPAVSSWAVLKCFLCCTNTAGSAARGSLAAAAVPGLYSWQAQHILQSATSSCSCVAHLCVFLVICCLLTHAPSACTVKILINACTTTAHRQADRQPFEALKHPIAHNSSEPASTASYGRLYRALLGSC